MQEFLDAAQARAIPVSELVAELRQSLYEEFGELWVEGEIGSLHRSRPGHLYFDLKDPQAQMRAVMFRRSSDELDFVPEEGMQVLARARLDIYAERGQLQLVVEQLKPYGEGALRLAFERLKSQLSAEGLFDVEHKRELPFLPRSIGVVTSLQGAAVHDFLRALGARFPAAAVELVDVRVQGEGAWRELVRGLHLLAARPSVDVIVLTRGGGSLEDLWNFNREELVRAIFELDTPVVSAIGHEVDWVLTDLVADVRAATPSSAADVVVPDAGSLQRQVDALATRLVQRQWSLVESQRRRVEGLRRGLIHPAQRIADLRRRLESGQQRLGYALDRVSERARLGVGDLHGRLTRSLALLRQRWSGQLQAASGRLDALSPLGVLGRGYSIARREADGVILRSVAQVESGDTIRVRLALGALRASVTETHEE